MVQRRQGTARTENAGLLMGNKSLIDKALMFQSPASGIGRDLKIAKETAIGMLAAVERYVKVDHAAEMAYWKGQIDYIRSVVSRIPGVEAGEVPAWVTNHVPRLWVKWDEKAFNFSREECFKALQQGEPSVVAPRTPMGVAIVTWMMATGEEKIVAQRLKEVLTKASHPGRKEGNGAAAELNVAFREGPWCPLSSPPACSLRERTAAGRGSNVGP